MTRDRVRLVLASVSPRRADILRTLGISFDVMPSGVDERALAGNGGSFARTAARAKLRRALLGVETDAFVLAADTVVIVDDVRLGQPATDDDALRMLGLPSGRDHRVETAVALGRVGCGELETRLVETRVWFRRAGIEELRRYVATGEGRDKAGAYGVQGLASGFVTRVDGSYTNVVGLPAAETVGLLVEHGAIERWP